MSTKEFTYIHKGKEYRLIVTRKRMKNIRYTYKDGVFRVSAPHLFVTQKQIEEGLEKYADKLIALDARPSAATAWNNQRGDFSPFLVRSPFPGMFVILQTEKTT